MYLLLLFLVTFYVSSFGQCLTEEDEEWAIPIPQFIDFEFDTERLPLAFWASAVYSLHPPDDFAPQQPLDEGLISQGVRRMDHVINETGLPVHESIVNLLRSCVDHVGLDAFLEHARAADTAMFNRLAAESGKPGGMINSNEFYTLDDLTQSFGQGDDVSGLKYAKEDRLSEMHA